MRIRLHLSNFGPISKTFAFVLGLLMLLASTGDVTAQRRKVPPSRDAVQYSYAPIVRKAAPAVVNVYVSSRVRTPSSPFANDPFFRRFFGRGFGLPRERMQSSLGSGVIVSADGVIVTNTHVVKARGRTEIRIALADKREFDAKVVSLDEKTDIAILKIVDGDESFPFLRFEDSDRLEVGDLVLAIGNPFGVGQTVTSGIVSGLARASISQSDAVFIQTDAAINPGNSGGALVDMKGKLVGINTAIFSRSGGSHGIGFAIPSNLVRLYVDSAVSGREVEKPWLGARLEAVTSDMADALGLDRVAGAVVHHVYDRSPAARAGLQPGDVIVKVEGFDVANERAVRYRMTTRGVGRRARLEVVRAGNTLNVTVKLVAAPKPGRDDVRNLSGQHPFDGARVSNILPSVAEDLELEDTKGVVIMSLRRGSLAARLRFLPGDIIVAVGRQKIRNLQDLETALRDPRRIWRLSIRRGRQKLQIQVPG